MTNRVPPENRERAEVVRAVNEMTNGKGLRPEVSPGGIVIPKMQEVAATADPIVAVADAVASCALLDRMVTLKFDPRTGDKLEARVPHFGAMLEKLKEEWKEPSAVQAAKIALVAEVARHQAALYELGPAILKAQQEEARAKIAAAQEADEAGLPEAPSESEARAPMRPVEPPDGFDANGSPCE